MNSPTKAKTCGKPWCCAEKMCYECAEVMLEKPAPTRDTLDHRPKVNGALVRAVVEVRTLEGNGDDVAMREVTWFFDTEGKLLAWHDPLEATPRRLLHARDWTGVR